MIFTHSTPPSQWTEDKSNKFYKSYIELLENIKLGATQKYPDSDILIVDNTYYDYKQVADIINQHKCNVVVIVSVVDPAYAWHYLDERMKILFPDKTFRYIGNLSPDIETFFWFASGYKEFTRYSDTEILPTNFDYVFLNYNYHTHEHRVKFIHYLRNRNLLDLGCWTLGLNNHLPMPPSDGMAQNIGDLDIWRRHFLNIVSETTFRLDSESLIISEKIIKPLIGLRPFLINGNFKYYTIYKKLGFDCFEDVWPVKDLNIPSDDLEHNMFQTHKLIGDVIEELQHENLPALYQKLTPRLKYNQNQWHKLAKFYADEYFVNPIKF